MTSFPSLASGDAVADADPRLGARGWLILVTLCGATFVVGLDFSIVAVALPEIGAALGFANPGDLQWVATACLLPTASLLLLFGRLSDLVGRRNLFLFGLLLLAVFSLTAGLAPAPGALVASRVGQGVAGAMISPTALSLLTAAFPDGPRRTRALGVNGALLSLGFVVGTIGGGVVTSALNWRWTMLIMLVIAGAVLVGGVLVLPRDAGRGPAARLDVPGAVAVSGGLFALVHGVTVGADAGWGRPATLAALAAAAVLLAVFVAVEARHPAPLVPLALLRRRTIALGGLLGLVTFGMCGGVTLLLSIYMQDVLGYSPLETGFGFLAEGVAALLAGLVAARIALRVGTRRTLTVGLSVQAAGTGAMVLLPADGHLPLLLATSGAMGFGHVLAVVASVSVMVEGVAEEERGVVGGLAQLPQFVGAIGTAGLAAVLTARAAALAPGADEVAATLGGLHAAVAVASLVCLAGAALSPALGRGVSPGGGGGSAAG
ncbi:MFS transporter [Streptomyces sp. NBRC 109706]|uniref:MFS transporter n=1 Tax=Streptomyces sp. NBRC 109706 TaxID=1550035 RepID=UPI000783F1B2|nr:MFS transporter [Streptomyces sp. NBRC 109706]